MYIRKSNNKTHKKYSIEEKNKIKKTISNLHLHAKKQLAKKY